jgi:hypothetical protein
MKVPELVSGIFIGGFQEENESNPGSGAKTSPAGACSDAEVCASATGGPSHWALQNHKHYQSAYFLYKIDNMSKNQKGLAHIGIILLAVVAIFICWIAVLVVNHNRHSKQAKADLDSNFASIKLPAGCTEDKRYYVKPGIDTRSSWKVYYLCSADINTIYDELKANAKSTGFTIGRDSANYNSRTHSLQSVNLILTKNGYHAIYYLSDSGNSKREVDLEFEKI